MAYFIWFVAIAMLGMVVFGFLGWVDFLKTRIRINPRLNWPEAWISAAIAIPTLTHLLGLISTTLCASVLGALLASKVARGARLAREIVRSLELKNRAHLLALAIPALYFFIKFIDAAGVLPHGDPLTYHLLGPLYWVERGRFHLATETRMSGVCNFFEMYFFLGIQWARWVFRVLNLQDPVPPRIAGQVFSQWLTLSLAFTSGIAILTWMLKAIEIWWRKYFSSSQTWPLPFFVSAAWLVAIAPQNEWLAVMAKNNWLSICFFLTAFLLFAGDARYSVRSVFAGAALAAAYWTKATNITIVVPLGIVAGLYYLPIFSKKRRGLDLAYFILGITLVSLPILARNYFWTENPFFPGEAGRFRSPYITDADRFDLRSYFNPFHFPPTENFWRQFTGLCFPARDHASSYLWSATAFNALGALGFVFFVGLLLWQGQIFLASLAILLCATAVFWLGIIIGPQFWEVHFPAFLLLPRLWASGFFLFLLRHLKNSSRWALSLVFALIGVCSVNLPIHVLWKDFWPVASGKRAATEMAYSIPFGRIYECLNTKTPPDAKIIDDGIGSLYYVARNVHTIGQHPEVSGPLKLQKTFQAQLQYLKEQGYTYGWFNTPCTPGTPPLYCNVFGDYRDEIKKIEPICSQVGGVVIKL